MSVRIALNVELEVALREALKGKFPFELRQVAAFCRRNFLLGSVWFWKLVAFHEKPDGFKSKHKF